MAANKQPKNMSDKVVFQVGRSVIWMNNKISNEVCDFKTAWDEDLKQEEESIDNILLINAWNEWGEKMAFEPSEEYGYYYLNLLYDYLKK